MEKQKENDKSPEVIFPVSAKAWDSIVSKGFEPISRAPVGRSYAEGNIATGNTRAKPVYRTEHGVCVKCMSCGEEMMENNVLSGNKLSFIGCPVCGNIDRSLFVYFNEDGLMGINEGRTNPQDFIEREFVHKKTPLAPSRPPNRKDVLKYRQAFKDFFDEITEKRFSIA